MPSREGSRKRTDHGFPILLDLERAFAVPDQKREIKQVLDGLRKVVRIDDESEKVHGTVLLYEQAANLRDKVERSRGGSSVDKEGRTDVDHMLRRLVLGSRNVLFAQFLWPLLVRLVLLELRAFAHHALFLFDRERPEPVTRLPPIKRHIRALLTISQCARGRGKGGGCVWRGRRRT